MIKARILCFGRTEFLPFASAVFAVPSDELCSSPVNLAYISSYLKLQLPFLYFIFEAICISDLLWNFFTFFFSHTLVFLPVILNFSF